MKNKDLDVLEKFNNLKGQILYGLESIKGKKGGQLKPDKYVDREHRLHDLIRGFYKPAGKKYILSYLATESKDNYGRQIFWKDDEKGEFEYIKMLPPSGEKDNRKKSDIEAARNNLKYGFPIGILHKLDKGVYRVLGLGRIIEETEEGIFIVKPYVEYTIDQKNDNFNTINEDDDIFNTENEIKKTEVLGEIRKRIGQDKLRRKLINKYKCCQICDIDIVELLIASHIKPWKDSDNRERLDIDNGLLLCPNHDKLFDKGFISFDNEGKIIISDLLEYKHLEVLGLNKNIKININTGNKRYIKWHREKCLK